MYSRYLGILIALAMTVILVTPFVCVESADAEDSEGALEVTHISQPTLGNLTAQMVLEMIHMPSGGIDVLPMQPVKIED